MKLAKGKVIPLPPGAFLRVEQGALWVTQYPDRNDYFLVAGESMRLGGKAAPLVSALRDSDFRVVSIDRSRGRWRDFAASLALRMRVA